jgi:serine/threonine protein kinase
VAPAVRSTPRNLGAGLLPVGSRLAEFEVTRVVGQGGFGAVYEAWDPMLERVVAIKEYLPTALSARRMDGCVVPLSERHRETFELGMRGFIKEARLLAQFSHPSLLKVYRFWQEQGTAYMVMPFYRGDTLKQALAAAPGGVDEGWLLRIMDSITQALAVMHAAHCYHRDIAPDNIILLEGSGRPMVLDFGAARRVIGDRTQTLTVILKPGYAPVEQYSGMPDMAQGAWTDVYALAAVMHVAVCGRAPPPSVGRLLSDGYAPLAQNDALRRRYSLRLLSAIDAGLGVRPGSRPQSVAALREALGLPPVPAPMRPLTSQRAGTAGATPPTQPSPQDAAEARRRRWVLAAFVGLLVVMAVAIVAAWWGR